jgi:hypothetical protein
VSLRIGPYELMSRVAAECALRVDQQVTLAVAMDRAHFFDSQTEAAVG